MAFFQGSGEVLLDKTFPWRGLVVLPQLMAPCLPEEGRGMDWIVGPEDLAEDDELGRILSLLVIYSSWSEDVLQSLDGREVLSSREQLLGHWLLGRLFRGQEQQKVPLMTGELNPRSKRSPPRPSA
jgi:hypothetical protein